jgi:hypothetical protein
MPSKSYSVEFLADSDRTPTRARIFRYLAAANGHLTQVSSNITSTTGSALNSPELVRHQMQGTKVCMVFQHWLNLIREDDLLAL